MDESTNNTPQSDSKMGLIIGAVVLVVVAAGAYYYWSNQMAKPVGTQTGTTSTQPAAMEADEEEAENQLEMAANPIVESAGTQSATAMVEEGAQSVTVEGGNFYFKPNEIRVKAGIPVKLTFNNTQGFHDFVIEELDAKTKQITAGNTEVLEFTPKKKGSYEFYCSVGQHRQMGMKGNLIVE